MDIDEFQLDLEKCIDALKDDLAQIRTGRATPELVEDILVDAYNTQAPIKNYANIGLLDSRSIAITPWDKAIIENISKAISESNRGFSPIIEGDRVRITVPELTEERRKEYVKIMKERVEDARVAIRSVRQKYMKDVDQMESDGMSEDDADRIREELEKLVKEYNEKVEDMKDVKENSLLTI